MPTVLLYLLKLSISLAIVWLFYQLLLRRLTFYNWNRWYLLGYSVLAFFIPLINIGSIIDGDLNHEPLVIQFIPMIGNYAPAAVSAGQSFTWNVWNILVTVIAAGALFLLVRSVVRWLSLRKFRAQAKLMDHPEVKVYQVDEQIIPFSFGNAIYINPRLHTEKEWEDIILHEYVHVRQRHTVDVLLSELFCILNWYNPFAWLIRFSLRQNLEFIADQQVLENGVDRKGYQYHLLKVIGEPSYRLANNFNFSSLKKRIIMMNTIRSARLHLVKFLFILPLIAVLLVAFRDKYEGVFGRQEGRHVNEVGIVADYYTHEPIAGVTVTERTSGLTTTTDARGFFRMTIPVTKDTTRIHLDYSKKGYEEDMSEKRVLSSNGPIGNIDIGILLDKSRPAPQVLTRKMPAMIQHTPVNPGYDDVVATLQATIRQTEEFNAMGNMIGAHKEVALFYTTEDKRKHIVILSDGSVEKYGYPGAPAVSDMEKKYGKLPAMMTPATATVDRGYLDQWAAATAQAEKVFHTTNPKVRQIIFPGDSRVLVVPVSGKPEMYDMENNDPRERPAFEALYGRLPDCIPAPSLHLRAGTTGMDRATAIGEGGASGGGGSVGGGPSAGSGGSTGSGSSEGEGDITVSGNVRNVGYRTDTVPANTDASLKGPSLEHVTVTGRNKSLYVIDGVRMPADWKPEKMNPADIYNMEVFRGEAAMNLYGKEAENGVIVVTTKSYHKELAQKAIDPAHPLAPQPLFIIDGVEVSRDALDNFNPNRINSISVLKETSAIAKYGDRGKNGVVIISLKKEEDVIVRGRGKDSLNSFRISVKPDSLRH